MAAILALYVHCHAAVRNCGCQNMFQSCIGHGELNKFCSIIVVEYKSFFLRYLQRIKRVYKSCVNYESKIHAFFNNVNSRLKNETTQLLECMFTAFATVIFVAFYG